MERHREQSPETPAEPIGTESEPLRESVDTVRELLDAWKLEYDQADGDRKAELAYRIVKLGEAVTFAGLSADRVYIREDEAGVLGFYLPDTGEIAITPQGLDLPPEHFQEVLVHEATHAGITTGKQIHDEGLTQIVTRQRVSNSMSGIYESEQRDAHEAFGAVGLKRVIDEYDFDHPTELIELYLETEWREGWESRWRTTAEPDALATPERRKAFLEGEAREWVERIEEAFEKAAPRLLDKAERLGFDFAVAHRKALEQLGTEELQRAA